MDKSKIKQGVELFLDGLGLDINDQHLKDTPTRVAKAWMKLLLQVILCLMKMLRKCYLWSFQMSMIQ